MLDFLNSPFAQSAGGAFTGMLIVVVALRGVVMGHRAKLSDHDRELKHIKDNYMTLREFKLFKESNNLEHTTISSGVSRVEGKVDILLGLKPQSKTGLSD